jgi:tetratricopeptide (TPR) repeat protein
MPANEKRVPMPAQAGKLWPVEPGVAGWQLILQSLLIVAAGLWVFWPALQGNWVWDDSFLVTNNPTLRSFPGLWKIWFAKPESDYWPLTWTVLWVQWHLWGSQPLPYHLLTLSLHLASAFLVWRLLGRLGLRWGWIGALLFVIHPLAVESVAWISEIKNTLSLPLFLLSLDAFMEADEDKNNRAYLRSLLLYLAAMLCKTSGVMLPVVFLLYNWWKRDHITRQDFKKTIPYFAIALILGLITLHFQAVHTPGVPIGSLMGVLVRLMGAGLAVEFYFLKFVFPTGLLPIYPGWTPNVQSLAQLLPLPLMAAVAGCLWIQRKGWGRHALLGLGFFLLNLLPVLGFLRMSYQNTSWVADHLVYLPMIGLIGLVVAGLEAAWRKFPAYIRPLLIGTMAVPGALLALESHSYARQWFNNETLWAYTIKYNPTSWVAYDNLAYTLLQEGRVREAVKLFEADLRIDPNPVYAHNNLGKALLKIPGRLPDAISEFKAALRIKPDYAEAHNNLGIALSSIPGRLPDAITEYEAAVRIEPDYAEAHCNLGIALLLSPNQRSAEATAHFKAALRINPEFEQARQILNQLQATKP